MIDTPDFSNSRRKQSICLVSLKDEGPDSLFAELRAKGHDVMQARDCDQALEVIELHQPNVVIIESGLADYQEISLVSVLRLRYPHIPVITLSRGNAIEGSALVHDRANPGESLLAISRSLLDVMQDVNQARPEPRLLNQYA